jgi:hypothetical protein
MQLLPVRRSTRKGRQRSMLWQGDGLLPDTAEPHSVPSPTLPSTEDVIRKTEQITKNIQELLRAAQENKHDRYGPPLRSGRGFPNLSIILVWSCTAFIMLQRNLGAGEMAQWLRALTALPEVLSSIPSNDMVTHNHL